MAVGDPQGMQLGAPGSTVAHFVPCAALVPFPVITHLLGSPFFREAAAGVELVTALAGFLDALAHAAPGHLGADDFKVPYPDITLSMTLSGMHKAYKRRATCVEPCCMTALPFLSALTTSIGSCILYI